MSDRPFEEKLPGACFDCPRLCGARREAGPGFCGGGSPGVRVSLVSRHMWEEPCISGKKGAGTVFFSGCSLKCAFCQNRALSFEGAGSEISVDRLSEIFLKLRDAGVGCLDLVTPTHYTRAVCEALRAVKHRLGIPVVWNSGGYELPGTLALTDGLVDVYMPDFKFHSPELAAGLADCPDYRERASEALSFMYRMLGPASFDAGGMMTRGLLVRHLLLPGCRADSFAVLEDIASAVPPGDIVLSLMSQYTPGFYRGDDRRFKRRVTTFEYRSVLRRAEQLGFVKGYAQSAASADPAYTPDFPDELKMEL